MRKIKSITLRNFKFFYGDENTQPQNKLELNGGHLLLYGENGSGKSSIYWALYTFLQSALKEKQEHIKKYFDPSHNQNLRNRFAKENEESAIQVEFQSEEGEIIKKIRRKGDNSYEINTFSDSLVRKVLEGSDFVNYKFLSKIYDFRNSESIDLFPLFERDLFMFINFEETFIEHTGNFSTKTYASDWWSFINCNLDKLPRRGTTVIVSSDEYKTFIDKTLPRFIRLLKDFLRKVIFEANNLLHSKFEEQTFSIDFDFDNIKCDYNKRIGTKKRDQILHKPRISLKIEFNHSLLSEGNKQIEKPHTFLNEAYLTTIALAIRLSILKMRPEFDDTARILVLDDLLISLDMSNRDKVLDIILDDSFINTYQLFILSHDKSFYNICKKRIESRFSEGWVFKEIYRGETENGIPCPFIPSESSYLDSAKKYFRELDYPAAVNYLRKESERLLKRILPTNLSSIIGANGTSTIQLDAMIKNFESYFKEIGGYFSPFEKLKEYKDLLLNPLSHDNINSPIYKREVLNVIDLLEKINHLEVQLIEKANDTNIFCLQEIDRDGDEWMYEFNLREDWRRIKDLDGIWKYSNPFIKVKNRRNITKSLALEEIDYKCIKIAQAYTNIRFKLNLRVKEEDVYIDNVKSWEDIIYRDGIRILKSMDDTNP
ncbi:MAG: AAA family ATPase [Dysgonomonas sp.]|nr:AAA family ATPase [Dysgonomonas sp.]